MTEKKIAFSLGGLAGNNAHGAGFLQAALDFDIEPSLISCTSGQIYWVYHYLQQKAKGGKKDLQSILSQELKTPLPKISPNFHWPILILFGKPQVFRPAVFEYMYELILNINKSMLNFILNPWQTCFFEEYCSIFPARLLVPAFPRGFFSNISKTFNNSDIGIFFNSYNPKKGLEYLHMNESAKKALGVEYGDHKSYRKHTVFKPITPESVKHALWIYQYGFSCSPLVFDGAYYRQMILCELAVADRIYIARPLNRNWLGSAPRNLAEERDLETEVGFNAAYAGEEDNILLINKLIKEGAFRHDKYHPVKLVLIGMDTQQGFFEYTREDMKVFEAAREQAKKKFKKDPP